MLFYILICLSLLKVISKLGFRMYFENKITLENFLALHVTMYVLHGVSPLMMWIYKRLVVIL